MDGVSVDVARPRESCDMQVVQSLLGFFGYPDGAATELYGGTLKLRYSSATFSKKVSSAGVGSHQYPSGWFQLCVQVSLSGW